MRFTYGTQCLNLIQTGQQEGFSPVCTRYNVNVRLMPCQASPKYPLTPFSFLFCPLPLHRAHPLFSKYSSRRFSRSAVKRLTDSSNSCAVSSSKSSKSVPLTASLYFVPDIIKSAFRVWCLGSCVSHVQAERETHQIQKRSNPSWRHPSHSLLHSWRTTRQQLQCHQYQYE